MCHSLSVQRPANAIIIGLESLILDMLASLISSGGICGPSMRFLVLAFYSPAMHSFKYPSFAAPQISFHPSLYVPLVCRLFNHLVLLIAAAEIFLRCSTDSVHVKFDGAGIQTDLPGRGVHQ
mmetsp:Transcript_15703/g.26752  ORF Transcript_15703/g.26752 Transcript_15703/m.26752 type:complete len:122 (-) Transcript_15703:297-662(-)